MDEFLRVCASYRNKPGQNKLCAVDLTPNYQKIAISELPASSFTGMSGLESLNLEHCSLRNLVLKDEVVVQLNLLQLEGNPLHCDCHARWLWNLAKNNTKITIRLPNCQSPFSAKGIPLQKLPGIKKTKKRIDRN